MKKIYIVLAFAPLFLTACAGNVSHRWCPPLEVVAEPAPVVYETETIQLSADALFKFDKARINDLLPKGKLELDTLIAKLKSHYGIVKQINITGHTDRLGSEQYNLKLGMERAETIRSYLLSKGIQTDFNISSKGKLQPVTTNCTDIKGREALKACLQPDRRVSLDIIGIKNK
ncbi:OmpA family protein [Acinetobacter faecalis]|uniref:OmpA family protein n=1 Tax=Acinetobacter faecalis TaxID=2665161 RepID=UPI002A919D1B|nr:OmpA family protein [Acinetobacter faecalis]MDY6467129.1 OmpA family protein [Acinetobacter faecalis]MDY6481077.1 OmpA family protein [Acinetobacter faecalis]